MTTRRILLCGAASFGLAMATQASAQSQSAAQTTPATAKSAPVATALGEVVVTARRREENLQKVPISVTAFSAVQLEQKGITDKTSLADFTPSMMTITGGYPSEFAYFALRGQGPAFGNTPGVVPYFSEVANPVGVDGRVGTYFDMANIQVLAGPQGTLFGKNATGGNILFEPEHPTNRYEGYIRVEGGNYNDRRIEGAVNIPIVDDKVLLRVAGEAGARDGYTTDVGPNFPGKQYDNLNYDSGRVSLTIRPNDRIELYTVGRYYYSNNNGPGTILEQINPATVAALSPYLPTITGVLASQQALGDRHVSYDLDEFSKTTYWQIVNHAKFKISDNLSFENVISYSQFRDYYGYDYDATPLPISGQSSRNMPLLAPNMFTEEARLQGTADGGALEYTAGVYYDQMTWQSPSGIQNDYDAPLTLFIGPISALVTDTGQSRAVFGQATYNIGDKIEALRGLSVTGGLRYTEEEAGTTIQIIAPPAQGGSTGFRYPSYTLNFDQALGSAANIYLDLRDAYKSGGINAGIPTTSPYATYKPEKLQDVEVGIKSQFDLGGMAARVNLDAYRGDYTNIQRTEQEDVGGGIFLNVNHSAAEGLIQGVEFTGALEPVKGFNLNASYSYIDSKYTKVTDPGAEAILQGSPFPYTPRNKISVDASYQAGLGDNLGTLVVSANYTYQSSFSTAQTNASEVKSLPAYGYANAEADLKDIGGKPVDVALFVTNLTNATYVTGDQDLYNTPAGTVSYTYAPPRMFGVRVRYKFGG